MPDEPTKRCYFCKRELPWSAFNLRTTERYTLNGASWGRLGKPMPQCKACDTIIARQRRARLRQQRIARHAQTRRDWLAQT
jgi:hypothetical protein